jgi:hypothetical protein
VAPLAPLTTHFDPSLIHPARNIIGPPLQFNYLQKSDWFSYPYGGPVRRGADFWRAVTIAHLEYI